MQQRYAFLLLLAAILFAGATIFSLCLLQPKREHSTPSIKKYGLDAYDALAGLPIRKRSGGSVIPLVDRTAKFLGQPSASNEQQELFADQLKACQSYPTPLCQAGVVYSQCTLTNEKKHAAPAYCLNEAFGRTTASHPHQISVEDEMLSRLLDEHRILKTSGFAGDKAASVVDVTAARQRAKQAGLAPDFLVEDEPRRP